MNIIFVKDSDSRARGLHLFRWYHASFISLLFIAVAVGLGALGFQIGKQNISKPVIAKWQQKLTEQRELFALAKRQSEADIAVLTQRVGQLQAHVNRIDALGNKLVEMADLDGSEFNFGNTPAMGGPSPKLSTGVRQQLDVVKAIERIESTLYDREQQLRVLDHLIMSRNLKNEIQPAGRPVLKGWISSGYGTRTDPFTGKSEQHAGVDFAARHGDDIVSVAGGMVTYADKRVGYGYMVEIDHGNGYATRYAHNKENLVAPGDAVKKGQLVALVGHSGRTTGSHVHFEVLKNGKHVDPMKFIKAQ